MAEIDLLARACIEKGKYQATFHEICHKHERDITLLDALHIIKTGYRVPDFDRCLAMFSCWDYAIEGLTLQEDKIRVIISFDKDQMLITSASTIEKNKKESRLNIWPLNLNMKFCAETCPFLELPSS